MNRGDHHSEAQSAESTYDKAVKAEHARQYDTAYRNYVHAAELFLHLNRSAKKTDKDEARWNAFAEKAIQRAEKIKAFVARSSSSVGTHHAASSCHVDSDRLNLTPIGINYFSARELTPIVISAPRLHVNIATDEQSYILKKGGLVNQLTVPPWDDPASLIVETSSGPQRQPALSPEQTLVSTVWKRPSDSGCLIDPDSRRKVLPEEILQHIVTDCSVCASISVCLDHNRRFETILAESIVVRSASKCMKECRYDVKLFFNGTWRRIGRFASNCIRLLLTYEIVVDDQLPYHPQQGTLMCMSVITSDGEPHCIWPSILEKAYMKLMGGYDFPGSNSSIDLHAIAGWIPEHLELRGPQFERERTWERINQGFRSGLCMITLGTGMTQKSWQGFELLPSHSYAVVDLGENNDTRIVTLLDTWVNPDHEAQQRRLAGRIEMPWFDVLNVFNGIYLSWDPSIWSNKLEHHGMWKRTGSDDNVRQLQLKFTSEGTAGDREIWVLLTRHVIDSKRTADFISLKVDIEDDLSLNPPNQNSLASQGTYTNSTHVLVRTSVPSSFKEGVLSIISSYEGDASEVGFTVTVHSSSAFSVAWDEAAPIPLSIKKIEGILSSKNSGGNCTHPTFMLNPQYHLRILPARGQQPTKARVTFTLQTSRDNPVNISVAWSQGERIDELAGKDLTVSSGAYTYGLARVTKDLAAGNYTIIVSAFEPRHMGEFKLKVESSQPIELSSIPQEGAGMYLKPIRGAWDSESAMGGPTSKRYLRNPTFEITVPVVCQCKIRLQLLRPSIGAALNLTLFPASSSETLGRHITTSGAYSDATCGVVTPQVTLSPGKYWAIPSTYNPGVEASFQLLLYTTAQNVKIAQKTPV